MYGPNSSKTNCLNPNITNDEANNTFDPASLVGLHLTSDEKSILLKMDPCQPSENILKHWSKMQGNRSRHCSQDIFSHDDGVKRKWVGYSLTANSVFCSQIIYPGAKTFVQIKEMRLRLQGSLTGKSNKSA